MAGGGGGSGLPLSGVAVAVAVDWQSEVWTALLRGTTLQPFKVPWDNIKAEAPADCPRIEEESNRDNGVTREVNEVKSRRHSTTRLPINLVQGACSAEVLAHAQYPR